MQIAALQYQRYIDLIDSSSSEVLSLLMQSVVQPGERHFMVSVSDMGRNS